MEVDLVSALRGLVAARGLVRMNALHICVRVDPSGDRSSNRVRYAVPIKERHMKSLARLPMPVAVVSVALAAACGQSQSGPPKPDLKIAMIAKSFSNPVFTSARAGAELFAKEQRDRTGTRIEIAWMTPETESGDVQAQRIAQAVTEGANAVLISCSDAAKVTPAINDAVAKGVPVMTFDSDAPESKRFAFLGTDDVKAGESVLEELAEVIGDAGNVAILAGNQHAPNLQKRVEGVTEAAKKHPKIKIIGTFYHEETADAATAEVLRVQKEHPQIKGWAMVGSWPLFGPALLTALDPAKVKIVAIDALPSEFAYVKSGLAPVLLAQRTGDWGHESVRAIFEKVIGKKDGPPVISQELFRVSSENLGTWARLLKRWGFTDVPAEYLNLP
jgi:ribose transport system substrate-binding protein